MRWEISGLLLFVGITVAVFGWYGKFVSNDRLHGLVDVIGTRGGNILVLATFSMVSMVVSVKMLTYMLEMSMSGRLSQTNVLMMSVFNFVTAHMSGTFFGALIATMKGDKPSPGREVDAIPPAAIPPTGEK